MYYLIMVLSQWYRVPLVILEVVSDSICATLGHLALGSEIA